MIKQMAKLILFFFLASAVLSTPWPFTVVKDTTYGSIYALDVNNTKPKGGDIVNVTFYISCKTNWSYDNAYARIKGPCEVYLLNSWYPSRADCKAGQILIVSAKYKSDFTCGRSTSTVQIWNIKVGQSEAMSVNFTMPLQAVNPQK
jgi:hypothetical protein